MKSKPTFKNGWREMIVEPKKTLTLNTQNKKSKPMNVYLLVAIIAVSCLIYVYCKFYQNNRVVLGAKEIPTRGGIFPWIGCGVQFIGNPTIFLENTRQRVQNTIEIISLF